MNNIHTSNAATEKKAADSTIVGAENYELPIVCDIDILRTLIRKKAARVVDVRKEEEYKQGHIPTAVSMPLAQVLSKDSEGIVDILESIGVSDKLPVIVYDDTFGALAARVAWTFQYVGHTNTSLLEVTFSRWKDSGLEIENQINTYPKTTHYLNINQEIHADVSYVENTRGNTNMILVDSRERLNFLTEHIPGAKNIPYTMLGSNGNILRKPDEIKRFIENRGLSSESEFITYCGSVGTLSGLAYYALKLVGIKNVKLYAKSFREWKSLGKPKEEFTDANYWDLSAE
ncbi:MAG TPA: rhodanese-like domain-containing protein [Nitrososphaeraceae archaeon]|jgi:thiosulfate/3-mercaptopyruvate sulfurtransferase|nr:rhodanese-like domain-containing protein [Nitrososphaeraceae archaeon]